MTDRKELAQRLLLEKAILDELQHQNKLAREAAADLYEPGDADSPRVDGERLGRVRMDSGRVSARLVDPAAFEEWVRANRPEQIEEVTRVYPAFVTSVLEAVKRDGGFGLDRATGEIGPIPPGVSVSTSPPVLNVSVATEGKTLARRLLAGMLPELEAAS